MKLMLVLFLSIITLSACSEKEVELPYSLIEAVYWHEKDNFSVVIDLGGGRLSFVDLSKFKTKIIRDLNEEEPMYVDCSKTTSKYYKDTYYNFCDIHIHSIKEVNGGEWSHGKFGSGRTRIIAP